MPPTPEDNDPGDDDTLVIHRVSFKISSIFYPYLIFNYFYLLFFFIFVLNYVTLFTNQNKNSASKEHDLAKSDKDRLIAKEQSKIKTSSLGQESSQLRRSKREADPLTCQSYNKGDKSNWPQSFVPKSSEHLQQPQQHQQLTLQKRKDHRNYNSNNEVINELSNEPSPKPFRHLEMPRVNSKVCFVNIDHSNIILATN